MDEYEEIYEKALFNYGNWIYIKDDNCRWTIEDFPYSTGVDQSKTTPHCAKCVAINRCYFVDENGKKPTEQSNNLGLFNSLKKNNAQELNKTKLACYHLNCHCTKTYKNAPNYRSINLIIPEGKYLWAIKDKGHLLKAMGYKQEEFNEAFETIEQLVRENYAWGEYSYRAHDEKGFRISFVLENFPGKNEKLGYKYKIKSGWTIFPNYKLKCNTIIGGLAK